MESNIIMIVSRYSKGSIRIEKSQYVRHLVRPRLEEIFIDTLLDRHAFIVACDV